MTHAGHTHRQTDTLYKEFNVASTFSDIAQSLPKIRAHVNEYLCTGVWWGLGNNCPQGFEKMMQESMESTVNCGMHEQGI